MHEHVFDEILDYLCSGIMSKGEKQRVRDELYDHLMCKYEINIACGMNEEKAAENAISDLGSKTVLKENLQKVHWYYPEQSIKSAMYLLILGLISPFLSLMFSSIEYMFNVGSIVSILSQILVFVSLFTLRTVNKNFRDVFFVNIITTALYVLNTAFEPFITDYLFISHFISLTLGALGIARNVLIYLGLKDLVKCCDDVKIVKNTALYYLIASNHIFISLLELKYSSNLSSFFGVFFAISAVLYFFVFINNMLKISDILYRSDYVFKVDVSVKNRALSIAAVFLFTVATICSADLIYSKTDINKSDNIQYSVEDCEIEQKEYERICKNIESYGINKKWVSVMPKSEILNYKNVKNKTELTPSAQELLNYYDHTLSGDILTFGFYNGNDTFKRFANSVNVYNYSVSLGFSEDGMQLVRFVKIFIVPQASVKKYYKDVVVFDDYVDAIDEMYPLPSDKPQCGDLLLAINQNNNKIFKRDVKILDYDEKKPIKGFVFDVEPGTIIIYATTRKIQDLSATINDFGFTYYHQKYPVIFPIRNIEDLFLHEFFSKPFTFDIYNYESKHFYAMPECEYVVPKIKE
ncbi:MAG: hypothetical protein E7547_01550 [Ruminococcaceae bacterium]|nr:hypothetical protein [Oscillospiraceae bacterium]